MEIELSEAINVAKGLTRHYKAFKKIEELLKVVQGVDSQTKKLIKAKDEVAGEISRLEKTKDGLVGENRNLKERHANKQDELKRETGEIARKFSEEKKRIKGEHEALVTGLETKKEEAAEAIKSEILGLTKERDMLSKELVSIRDSIARLRERFAA